MQQDKLKELERKLHSNGIDITSNPHGFILDVETEIESFRDKVSLYEEFVMERSFENKALRFFCSFVEDEFNGKFYLKNKEELETVQTEFRKINDELEVYKVVKLNPKKKSTLLLRMNAFSYFVWL
ncbi:hypothetical protein [Heyndrickxia oleronia]|jgi:sugar phosphate isomerase/epimerase|uniref:hypothetical protein n=1 Tax=Heyndrickxia oleronia TaxID=38875 RepID=UPI003752B1CA